MKVTNLLDFCNQPGYNELEYQPVITLMKTDSQTDNVQSKAVVVDSYSRYEDSLVISTIDSASETGETLIECKITVRSGQQKLMIGGKVDQWCLGSDKCYVLYFS